MADLKEGSAKIEMQGRGRGGQGLLGLGLRSWICIDSSGDSQVIEVEKFTIMHLCGLRRRYLHLLDPMFDYPSCILGRKKAIVLNLGKIHCVITVDEVLVPNSTDAFVMEYMEKLKQQLQAAGNTSPVGYLPFEFQALEFALEDICTSLDSQAEVRNQLKKLELLLMMLVLVLSISDVATGVFGMHFPIGIFENSSVVMWILIINEACSILVLGLLLWSLKSGGVIPIE